MSTNLRTLKQAGKFARLPIFIMLCVAMLFSCIAPTFAVNTIPTASVTSTGGTLKDSVLGFKENGVYGGYIYIVEVSKEAEAVTIEIAGGFSQDVPYAITPLGDDDYDAPDLDTDDYSYDGNALTFTLKDVSYNSPVLIYDPPLAQETSFAKWMNYSFYMIRAFAANDDLIAILCYQAADANVDKSKLEEALDAVPTSGYYTSDDRYNGKTESKTGFWNEMQVIVDAAQAVYDNKSAAQGAVDAAAKTLDQKDPDSALSKAIANLIPTSQVNPTGLHETLPLYSDLDEKEYSTNSWAAFYRKRTDAQNLYDSLFTKDAEGNVTATEENSSAKHPQEAVDALVKELQDAAKNLKTRVWSTLKPGSENALAGIALYAGYYDTLKEADYTSESWQNYAAARKEALDTAKEHGTFTTTMGTDEIALQSQAFNKVRTAYFSLVPKSEITVRVSLTDELAAKQPTGLTHRVTPRTQKLTVPTGTTIGGLLTNSFKNEKVWRVNSRSQLMVYVNGTLAFWSAPGEYYLDYLNASEYQAFKLHDGDEVTVVRVQMPTMVNISEDLWPMALGRVTDKIRYQTLTTNLQKDETTGAYKAVVGVPFTLTATSKAAMPAHMTDDEAKPTAGAYVFRSMSVDDYESVVNAEILTDTKLKTGADGSLTMTVYQPGWQLINVFDLDSDDAAFVNGGAILIYASVDESQADLTKIKNDLRAELKKTYENPDYPKECFTEADWQTIETLYKTGMEGIDAAKDAASAYAAQLTAKSGIETLQRKAADTNAKNLADFRALMKRFPEDLTKLDASAVKLIDQLESYYNAMTQYQRDELSVQETKRYNEILAAREGLAAGGAKNYTLTVAYDLSAVPEEDKGGLEAMIKWLQEHRVVDGTNGTTGGTMMAGLFTFNKVNTSQTKVNYEEVTTVDVGTDVYFCANPTYATYFQIRGARKDNKNGRPLTDASVKTNFPYLVTGNDYAITDTGAAWRIEDHWVKGTNTTEVPHFYVNDNEYELRGITFSGVSEETIEDRSLDTFDYSDYGTDIKANRILRSFKYFTMPYDNVTATVTWVPVGGSESEIAAAKDSAKTALKTALDGYGEDHNQYKAILDAYNKGLAAIDSAKTVEQVAVARREALKSMANAANDVNTGALIKGWEYDEGEYWELTGFDPGPQIGTVTVSVQNYTNDGSNAEGENKAALEHFYRPEDQYWLERKNYPLGQNDTMMTVLLRALTEKKCTWLGTGGNGDEKYDFDITYLSTITDGDYSLAEFTGGQQSGWMGTLNDWFTNEGFANFTVENGKLADGDIISIKYTSVGLGEDVGGTWSNSDTTLKSLTFDGDGNPRLTTTFEPGKRGGTYTYTLVIDGASSNLTVTPTAANKNFLVKTFLNEKVTSNTEGSSFYKRTESIPAVAGDTIYIGCGIKGWPTMNNQAGNTQSNDGTWYVVRVLSASGSYKVVEDQLKQLPQADTIDFTNYEKYEKQIAAAEAAYKQLQSEQQAKVNKDAVENLEKLLEKVQSYRKLKEFKATVKSLPRPAEATLDDVEEIRSAQRTYEEIKKNSDLYESLSVAETRKMDELIEAADTLIWNDAVEKINAIGTVTINSGDAINAAKAAVSRLSADQLKTFPQELLDKLAEAERIYHLLTEGSGTPVLPVTPSKPKNDKPTTGSSFTDVPAGSWYEEAVNYVHEKGLMNGTSSNAFSPNANTTRGMIVTILARVEGVNTSGALWYAAGQKWAMDNGISDGTNMPGVITREQLATILYRYAKQKGYDVSKSAALTGFSDADKVSGYAAEAMQWAVAEGLLQGSNGKLNPQGSATRAQVATILMRFMEKIAK
ncbi:MAG: S-layer homology domain-containing protein [Oscillospiraceae bacterium]